MTLRSSQFRFMAKVDFFEWPVGLMFQVLHNKNQAILYPAQNINAEFWLQEIKTGAAAAGSKLIETRRRRPTYRRTALLLTIREGM